MRTWNDFPTELRRKCVENMDLTSRQIFRSCSAANRKTDESVRLFVPRVRYGEKLDRYLIVIYTGIEKFIRLEFCKESGKTVLYKSVNTLKNPKRKVLPYSDHYELAVLTLKSLFCRPNVTVDTFEWNVAIDCVLQLSDRFMQIIGRSRMQIRIHANRSMFRNDPIVERRKFFKFTNGPQWLWLHSFITHKGVDMPFFQRSDQDVAPNRVESILSYKSAAKCAIIKKQYSAEKNLDYALSYLSYAPANRNPSYVCFPMYTPTAEKAIFDVIPSRALQSNDGALIKIIEPEGGPAHAYYFRYSKACGLSVAVTPPDSKHYRFNWKSMKCGKGYFCPTHATDFECWYMKQPSMFHTEPFWADIGGRDMCGLLPDDDVQVEEEVVEVEESEVSEDSEEEEEEEPAEQKKVEEVKVGESEEEEDSSEAEENEIDEIDDGAPLDMEKQRHSDAESVEETQKVAQTRNRDRALIKPISLVSMLVATFAFLFYFDFFFLF